jgi:hypothetical protein
MAQSSGAAFDWDPFIGRVLARVCLHLAEMDSKSVIERAEYLMALGLPRSEAAQVLGSTDESLRVMQAKRAARTKGAAQTGPAS